MSPKAFLGSLDLGRVVNDLRMTCLDIGARNGFTKDLLPLAPSVDACGFEPDLEECERLNRAAAEGSHPWRSLRFIPTALGKDHGTRTLNLYRRRGCSSLLKADVVLAETFSRGDYFQLDDTIEVSVMSLDAAAMAYGFTDAVYMKVDVEGAELEVFESGPQLLGEQILVIRTEVPFLPMLRGQPLYNDIDTLLRSRGFVPMGFLELHHWRRTTRRKLPELAEGPTPYSRGQIIHGDMLYFRDPASMADNTPQEIQALVKASFLALTYGYVDHAAAIITRPAVARYFQSTYGFDVKTALSDVSRNLAYQHCRAEWHHLWRDAKRLMRQSLQIIGSR